MGRRRWWPSFGVRDSLKNPLHFVGIRQSAPTVKEERSVQFNDSYYAIVIKESEISCRPRGLANNMDPQRSLRVESPRAVNQLAEVTTCSNQSSGSAKPLRGAQYFLRSLLCLPLAPCAIPHPATAAVPRYSRVHVETCNSGSYLFTSLLYVSKNLCTIMKYPLVQRENQLPKPRNVMCNVFCIYSQVGLATFRAQIGKYTI